MPFEAKWTLDDKRNVVNWYILKGGNSITAAKYTGVPAQTIRGWTKTDWWVEMCAEVRKKHASKFDSKMNYAMDMMMEALMDRVRNGDEVLWAKTGEMVKKAMSGRDLSTALNQVIEKRALLRGDATSRAGSVSSDKQMETLQAKMEERIKEQRAKQKAAIEDSENVEEIGQEA